MVPATDQKNNFDGIPKDILLRLLNCRDTNLNHDTFGCLGGGDWGRMALVKDHTLVLGVVHVEYVVLLHAKEEQGRGLLFRRWEENGTRTLRTHPFREALDHQSDL